MQVSLISAVANNRIIGSENSLPWHLPADFQWFKQCTFGKPIIMGRKTFESIGKPLPGRANIILSRNHNFTVEGAYVVSSIERALKLCEHEREVMIVGGARIYARTLHLADKLYLTHIDADISGDARFPVYNYDEWAVEYEENYQADAKNQFDMTFRIYNRK